MNGSSGFTILFSFDDAANEFAFINGHYRFQATVTKKDMDVPVYFVTKICRYDVYEITELIASYQLTRVEKHPAVLAGWKYAHAPAMPLLKPWARLSTSRSVRW